MSEEDKVEQHEHPHSSAGKEKGQNNVLIAKKYYIYVKPEQLYNDLVSVLC